MKKIIAICVCLFAFAGAASAQEKKFFIEDDGSVNLRVEKLESKTSKLEADVAALKAEVAALKKPAVGKPIVKPTAPAAPAAAPVPVQQFKTVRVQVCENGRCRFVNQLVPLTDLEMAALTSGAKAGACTNCTDCADGCKCFGGGYYCADGKCPISYGASGQTTTFSSGSGGCASGQCGSSSGRTGWYPGKRLGR